jgi:hypothetical protein
MAHLIKTLMILTILIRKSKKLPRKESTEAKLKPKID